MDQPRGALAAGQRAATPAHGSAELLVEDSVVRDVAGSTGAGLLVERAADGPAPKLTVRRG